MTQGMTHDVSGPEAGTPVPAQPLGEVNFYAPSDWLDILADPGDEEAARARFEELTRLAFPNHAREAQQSIADAVMNTRRIFLADGMLSCGLVTLPQTEDGPVLWQISSGVVEVGTLDPDLDIGSVLTRYVGQQLDSGNAYVEHFPTAIGAGVGLISTPQVFADGAVTLCPAPTPAAADAGPAPEATLGLAVALAVPAGGGRGLLVVGQCLDAGQVRELACVVALIAGKSTIEIHGQENAAA